MIDPVSGATPALILASASAARAALLQAAGVPVAIRPVALDEAAAKRAALRDGLDPNDTALRLAGLKAAAIDDADAMVIGADQILCCEGRRFDKPADRANAAVHLRALRDREHTLHTALVVRHRGQTAWQHVAVPRLRMRALSDAFIERYLDREAEAVLGCVGAYRLEGPGIQLFDRVEGEHAAILGLPLLPLLGFLRQSGLLPD